MIDRSAEGTKALVVGVLLAAVVASAAYVAQSDLTGSRAMMASEMARKVGDEHKAVCQRLGHTEAASGHARCLEELMLLKLWHDEVSAAQNESLL